MKISQIIIIVIFIIFLIAHISQVSTSNLDISLEEIDKNGAKLYTGKSPSCAIEFILSILNDRNNKIFYINITGVIIGILLGVIQLNYINNLNLNNSLKILLHSIIIISYIILIILSGVTFDSDGYLLNKLASLVDPSKLTIENITSFNFFAMGISSKTNNLQIGLKPFVPFLGALTVSSLIIIITSIDELSSKSSSNYESISDTNISSDSI